MNLQVIEHNGQRVLTTAQLAEAYGTDPKVISKNLERNRKWYEDGKHFISLTGENLRQFKANRHYDDTLKYTSVIYLWTKKGAFLAAKSLNTDKAWDAYGKLVDGYFELEQQVKVLTHKEQLEASMELTLITSKEVSVLKNEMKEIRSMVEEQITLDHGEQRRLQRAVGAKVYELTSDKDKRVRLFRELYRDIKDRFGVASYRDIKRHDILKAIGYIEAWIPKKEIS